MFNDKNFLSLRHVTLDGTLMTLQGIVRREGAKEYGVIQKIFTDGVHSFFYLQRLQVIAFNAGYHAYQVARTEEMTMVSVAEVSHVHCLSLWTPYGLDQPLFISDRTSDISFFP